ncbi:hypothetical protein NG2371_05137 [Nocardia gamkensis]|nr:hypothetical protein [Nocardia gamkensis]
MIRAITPRALLWLKDRFAGAPVGAILAAAFQQPIGSGR